MKTETHKYHDGMKAKHDFRWRPRSSELPPERKRKEKQCFCFSTFFKWKPKLLRVVEPPFISSFPEVAREPKGCGQRDGDIRKCVFIPVLNHAVHWNQWMFNLEHLAEDPSIDFHPQDDYYSYIWKEQNGKGQENYSYNVTKALDHHKTEIKAIFWNTKGWIRNRWREV